LDDELFHTKVDNPILFHCYEMKIVESVLDTKFITKHYRDELYYLGSILLNCIMLLLFTVQQMKMVLHWVANTNVNTNFLNSIFIFVSVHVLLGFQLLVVLEKFNGGCVLDITLRTNSFL
jgi:hypothetical protein